MIKMVSQELFTMVMFVINTTVKVIPQKRSTTPCVPCVATLSSVAMRMSMLAMRVPSAALSTQMEMSPGLSSLLPGASSRRELM